MKSSALNTVETLQCRWCNSSFRSERTLATHVCVRKRRWADRDLTHVRLAFRVFQMFYDITVSNSKPKTPEDFIASAYYEGFVKFGRSCVRNEYLAPEKFAEWLIKNSKKLVDWSKDSVYNEFLLEYVRREPGLRALERTIMYLSTWAEESGADWQDYFKVVSTPRAVYDIRAAKISPWVLYLSQTGAELLVRLSSEQVRMIDDIIDAKFWMTLFKENPNEVAEIQNTCEAAGI